MDCLAKEKPMSHTPPHDDKPTPHPQSERLCLDLYYYQLEKSDNINLELQKIQRQLDQAHKTNQEKFHLLMMENLYNLQENLTDDEFQEIKKQFLFIYQKIDDGHKAKQDKLIQYVQKIQQKRYTPKPAPEYKRSIFTLVTTDNPKPTTNTPSKSKLKQYLRSLALLGFCIGLALLIVFIIKLLAK